MKLSTQVLTHVVHLWDGQQIAVTSKLAQDILDINTEDKDIFRFRGVSWKKSAVSKITEMKPIKRWRPPDEPVRTKEGKEKALNLIKKIREKYCNQ